MNSDSTAHPHAIPTPWDWKVLHTDGKVIIRWPWKRWDALPTILLLVFLFGFVGFLFPMILRSSSPLMPSLILLGFSGAIGLPVLYQVISCFVNWTEVTISKADITSASTPLWWNDKRTVTNQDIRRFCIRKWIDKNRFVHYRLMTVDHASKVYSFMEFTRPDQATFIAGAATQLLNLSEVPTYEETTLPWG